jgi:hypothetical protein
VYFVSRQADAKLMDEGTMNADSESMFLNDLFGDGLDTDAVLDNTAGIRGGMTDPSSVLNDFDMPDSPDNAPPDNIQWAGDADDGNLMAGSMPSALGGPVVPTMLGSMPQAPSSAPRAAHGGAAGTTSSGRATKPPSNRASTGGGRKRGGAAAAAAAAAQAAQAAQAAAAGGAGGGLPNADAEDVHSMGRTHIDVNVNTGDSRTHISVTTGQVKLYALNASHAPFLNS